MTTHLNATIWISLGLAAGALASMRFDGAMSRRIARNLALGCSGALLGGWFASLGGWLIRVWGRHGPVDHGRFDLQASGLALAGAVLLLAVAGVVRRVER